VDNVDIDGECRTGRARPSTVLRDRQQGGRRADAELACLLQVDARHRCLPHSLLTGEVAGGAREGPSLEYPQLAFSADQIVERPDGVAREWIRVVGSPPSRRAFDETSDDDGTTQTFVAPAS
jgi:hypothetical protein